MPFFRFWGFYLLFHLCSIFVFAQSTSLDFLNRMLNLQEAEVTKSIERIAGGRYLLPDDPVNYVIYEKLEKQIRGLGREIANGEDLINYYRFQDAVLGELLDVIQRIRELLIQRTGVIISEFERDIINGEIRFLYDHMAKVLERSEFNGIKIFSQLTDSGILQSYLENEDHYNLENVDILLNRLITERSWIGAKYQSLEFELRGKAVERENTARMQSLGDTDISKEAVRLQTSLLLVMIDILMFR